MLCLDEHHSKRAFSYELLELRRQKCSKERVSIFAAKFWRPFEFSLTTLSPRLSTCRLQRITIHKYCLACSDYYSCIGPMTPSLSRHRSTWSHWIHYLDFKVHDFKLVQKISNFQLEMALCFHLLNVVTCSKRCA